MYYASCMRVRDRYLPSLVAASAVFLASGIFYINHTFTDAHRQPAAEPGAANIHVADHACACMYYVHVCMSRSVIESTVP